MVYGSEVNFFAILFIFLLLSSVIKQADFQSGYTADIDKERCTECGLCRELCRWNAIDEGYEVNQLECEGCGVCVYFCSEKAMDLQFNTLVKNLYKFLPEDVRAPL